MLGVWEAGLIACWIILWKGLGRSRGMNSKMWRTVLIWERCLAVLRRCRDENLRSASTRRHTLGTGVVLTSEYLEKTGSFIVKSSNKCRVFRCTVNWIRARPKTTLIAGGAQRSSLFYAAGVRECAAAGVGSSVLQADGNAAVIRDTVKSLQKTPQRNLFPEAFSDCIISRLLNDY